MSSTAIDFAALAEATGIQLSPERHKHNRDGWLQTRCPFCSGNPGYHLGYNLAAHYFNCWRCGWHSVWEAVSTLCDTSNTQTRALLQRFAIAPRHVTRAMREVRRVARCDMPVGTRPMSEAHVDYLRGRGFNANYLAQSYGMRGTGPIGFFKLRIVYPVRWGGVMVSFRTRDITDKHPRKYLACPQAAEVIDHKTTIYGLDDVTGDTIVVVEGETSVWRLGVGAGATYGTNTTDAQVRALKRFRRRIIMFDNDEQDAGIVAAEKLAAKLSSFPGHTEIIEDIGAKDPACLPQRDADALMDELMREKT